MKHISGLILLSAAAALTTGCSADGDAPQKSGNVRLEIWPVLNTGVTSRAATDAVGSYTSFENGDICGFYSEHRTSSSDTGYDNLVMTFNGGVFSSDQTVDINLMGHTFIYYPYNEAINEGIDVRTADGSVIDLLAGSDGSYIIQQGYTVSFVHAFSMLIIKGGKGFEHITDEGKQITVTIDRPVEKIRLADSPDAGSLKLIELIGDDLQYADFAGVRKGKTTDQATGREVDAWFIIIPTGGNVVKVKSITAEDDLGRKQVIPVDNSLINYGNGMDIATRYPLTLKMDEFTPTISVDNIIPWDSEVVDTETTTGINSVFSSGSGDNDSSFERWAATYSSYVNSGRSAAYEATLKRFGNKDENGVWHFTVNVNIDLTDYPPTGSIGQAVAALEDELDCTGHTISNLTLANSSSAGLIGEIRGNGRLANVRLENFSVTGGDGACGVVAAKISGGSVENCTVLNLQLECDNAVGALAGEMTGGSATGCRFAGRIIGRSTAQGDKARIAGIYKGGTLSDIDVANVAFGQKNQ